MYIFGDGHFFFLIWRTEVEDVSFVLSCSFIPAIIVTKMIDVVVSICNCEFFSDYSWEHNGAVSANAKRRWVKIY